MALGIAALGEDRVAETGELGAAVTAAEIERRRDDGLDSTRIEGDRLWVATGSEVHVYDLGTRELVGTLELPDAVALAYDERSHLLYVGTRGGEILIVDTVELDANRNRGPTVVEARAFFTVDAGLDRLFLSRDGERLLAILHARARARPTRRRRQ